MFLIICVSSNKCNANVAAMFATKQIINYSFIVLLYFSSDCDLWGADEVWVALQYGRIQLHIYKQTYYERRALVVGMENSRKIPIFC